MIVSDDDLWVELEESREIASHFNATFTTLKNAGHINADSGYGKWNQFINNPSFIALVHYYKDKSIPKISIPVQHPYHFEKLKSFDTYWNKDFIDANLKKMQGD